MGPDAGLKRLAAAVAVVSLLGWGAVLVAAAWIPSPARETRFVDSDGRPVTDPPHCYRMVVIDEPLVWMSCRADRGIGGVALTRFDTRTGRATVMGALPETAAGLRAGIAGPESTRVFLAGNALLEVRDDHVSALGTVSLPLGLAKVGDGIEVLSASGPSGLNIERYVDGRLVSERMITRGAHATDLVSPHPTRAYHDGAAWRVLVLTYPRGMHTLPLTVTIHDESESGEARVVGSVELGEDMVFMTEAGATTTPYDWFLAGNVLPMAMGARELRVFRPNGITTVRFPDAPFLDIAAAFVSDGPHARVSVTDIAERRIWLDGTVLQRFDRNERFVVLGVDRPTSPTIVTSFWMEPGFRVVPHPDGSATLLGALAGSYVQIGANLARTDALSLAERFQRLFVADRAKRNGDMLSGVGLARFAIIPFILLGPLVCALVLGLRRRREGLARGLAFAWLAIAITGAYPFSYYLRYYF